MGQTIAQRFEVLRTKQDLSLEDSIRFRNFCDKHAIDACVHCAFHAACNLIADYMEFCDIDEMPIECQLVRSVKEATDEEIQEILGKKGE